MSEGAGRFGRASPEGIPCVPFVASVIAAGWFFFASCF
jgi:hypothetical protein